MTNTIHLFKQISLVDRMAEESPFKRKRSIFAKNEPCLQSTVHKAILQLDEAFLGAIPSEDVKQLPPNYLYPVGSLVILVLVAIFVAVFVPGFESEVRTKFLSPVGSGNSRYCDDVTISNTGTFLATRTGYWQGSKSFAYSNASYAINLVNVQMDDDEFYSFMMSTYKELVAAGTYTKTHNLGMNLLYWMSWVSVGESGQRYTMTGCILFTILIFVHNTNICTLLSSLSFSGTPLVIFNREHTVGTISNVQHDCNESSIASFNPSSGIMQISYSLAAFSANPSCAGNGNINDFGYSETSRSSTFTVGFDIRTHITAVAVNSNVTKVEDLQLVHSNTQAVGEDQYYVASYIDPRYPGMDPVLCIHNKANVPSCLLSVGDVYGIPVFNHNGNNNTYPGQCNCTEEVPKGLNSNYSDPCNVFNFLTSFIYWPNQPGNPYPGIELMLEYTSEEIYEFAYSAMFTAGAFGMSSPVRDTFNSPAQRQDMYSFCNTANYGQCSIVTFSSFDSSFGSRVVSPNFYAVEYGACSDTLETPRSKW